MSLRLRFLAIAAAALALASPALAQAVYPVSGVNPGITAPGVVILCPTLLGTFVPCGTAGALPLNPSVPAPAAPVNITGNSTGSTGAVVGSLTGVGGKITYICGFDVSAIGGTAAVGPVTIAGLIGSSMVFQISSTAAGLTLSRTFTPCIPASAANTSITITTTADGTATAVDVNSWGYQQ